MTSTRQAGEATEASVRWRAVLLAAVAACAACGLVYELALLTLAASLNGGGIVATSLIVAGYIAALGAGALLIKPLLAHAAIAFIAVEAVLGIIGGLSAAALYAAFAFLDELDGSTLVLAVGTALIGGLVGAEVPLLMTLLQRGRVAGAADAGRTLANLNAADYLGALVGGLAWPFLLLPQLGMIRGAAVTGIVNLAAAGVVSIFLLRHVVSGRQLVTALCALAAALGLIATLLVHSHDIETTGRQQLYADPIIAYRHSAYQEIVVTRRGDDLRLYLDGGLQFCTRDEYRYTESLVYPAVSDGARSVLVLGGGDGLAARELLRQPGIEQIVQVELDPAVIELARTTLRDVNAGSLDNPRVHVVIDDAMSWLRGAAVPPAGFDAVIVDLRDPDTPVLGRLYSTEFYALPPARSRPAGSWSCRQAARIRPRLRSGASSPRSGPPGMPSRPTTCTCPPSATGDSPWHALQTSRPPPLCRALPLHCASWTNRCSRPRPCFPATSGPARWTRRPWTIRTLLRTCGTAGTSAPI